MYGSIGSFDILRDTVLYLWELKRLSGNYYGYKREVNVACICVMYVIVCICKNVHAIAYTCVRGLESNEMYSLYFMPIS